jgi:aldose sugar dehydrogenase
MRHTVLRRLLSPFVLLVASCGNPATGESADPAATAAVAAPFTLTELATFDEPWAMALEPGTGNLFVTERGGKIKFLHGNGRLGFVSGVPAVDYGGQGGLGDFVFAHDYAASRQVYLSWVEAGDGDTRGAVVGRAKLLCEDHDSCELRDMQVIWRQSPKVTGRGHYSHRIAFSPDGRFLFIASGDRQKMSPAQNMGGNLGKIVRLLPDGKPAPGNPFAAKGGVAAQVWSLGHRNILSLNLDAQGRLWDLEHGPRGGDELNLVKPGQNYGWPMASNGDHYDGRSIPRHSTRTDFAAPAVSWNPVIAPGGMIFYSGSQFPEWRGQALIAAMNPAALVLAAIDGESAREVARYAMAKRIRAVLQRPDGSILLLEDGKDNASAKLLHLAPKLR